MPRVGGLGDDFGDDKMPHRLRVILLPVIGQRGIELHRETLGKPLPRLLQGRQGLAGFRHLHLGHGQVVIRRLNVRAEQDGFAERLDGFRRLAVFQRQPAQVVIGLGIGRVVAQDGPELFTGPRVVAAAQVNRSEIGPHPLLHQRQIRRPLQHLEVKLRRPLRVAQQKVAVRQLQPQQRGQRPGLRRPVQQAARRRICLVLERGRLQANPRIHLGQGHQEIRVHPGLPGRLVQHFKRRLRLLPGHAKLNKIPITGDRPRRFPDRHPAGGFGLRRLVQADINLPQPRIDPPRGIRLLRGAQHDLQRPLGLLAAQETLGHRQGERVIARVLQRRLVITLLRKLRLPVHLLDHRGRITGMRLDRSFKGPRRRFGRPGGISGTLPRRRAPGLGHGATPRRQPAADDEPPPGSPETTPHAIKRHPPRSEHGWRRMLIGQPAKAARLLLPGALLVTMRAQLLAPFMLVNLSFPSFLQ